MDNAGNRQCRNRHIRRLRFMCIFSGLIMVYIFVFGYVSDAIPFSFGAKGRWMVNGKCETTSAPKNGHYGKVVSETGRRSLVRIFQTIPEGFENICEQLFTTAESSVIGYSDDYVNRINALKLKIKTLGPNATSEGDSGELHEQTLMLHHLARAPTRTVCETGFNVGYSAFAYLSANSNVTVHSFDIGRHPGTRPMVDYLKGIYGDRLNVHFGDSTITLPEFLNQHPTVKCDVIFVDGCHHGEVPYADIKNFANMAIPGESLMIFDDYPTDWAMVDQAPELGGSWEVAVHHHLVSELMRCTFNRSLYSVRERGFVIGQVLKLRKSWHN